MKQSGTVVSLISSAGCRELPVHEREVLEVLRRRGGKMWALELLHICKANQDTLTVLEQQGYVVTSEEITAS